MAQDLKDFWNRFQSGIDIAVAGQLPDRLLGVRDGFLRYFRERHPHVGPVRVVPHAQSDAVVTPIPLSDDEILALARNRALELKTVTKTAHAFYVAAETGLVTMRSCDQQRHFVRTWAVVLGLGEESWGASGAVQLPESLIQGLDQEVIPFAIPGTRRGGGMMSSLTGGLETRRTSTALAIFYALSSLTYGLHEFRPRASRAVRSGGPPPTS